MKCLKAGVEAANDLGRNKGNRIMVWMDIVIGHLFYLESSIIIFKNHLNLKGNMGSVGCRPRIWRLGLKKKEGGGTEIHTEN